MRIILPIVMIVALGGCSGTSTTLKRPAPDGGDPSRATPLISERPSLSDRLRYSRQRDDEQAFQGLTRVEGNLVR